MTSKRGRKLDQFLRGDRVDPEVAIQQMSQLSNRLFHLLVGIGLAAAMTLLVVWPISGSPSWASALGIVTLLTVACGLTWFALQRIQPRVFDRPAGFNQLVFLLSITVALSWIVFRLRWSPYLAPVPILAMTVSMTFGQPGAFTLVTAVSLFLGFLYPRTITEGKGAGVDVVLSLVLAMGGMVAVLGMSKVRQQSRPFMVGIYTGLVQGLLVLAFEFMGLGREGPLQFADLRSSEKVGRLLEVAGWALGGGLIAGAAVTCLLPALETFFGVVTERRLLALNDPSNDLLQALRNQAPGTYTHSLRVADLASAAAEAIGADPLFSRVGAYYHDIGKITRPEYFVENRESGLSIHDRLRPNMSKLIIISHVKEGIELAEEARLPRKIIDLIPMHHGTTVVEYFYHKAQTEGEACDSEVAYRYPGPRPRFREAGILMLADGVEATAKAIVEPNPSRFRDMVHALVLKRLLDHQLDESDLTMRDLTRIEDSFVHTLTYMYHGRIKYPEKGAAGAPGTGRERGHATRNGGGTGKSYATDRSDSRTDLPRAEVAAASGRAAETPAPLPPTAQHPGAQHPGAQHPGTADAVQPENRNSHHQPPELSAARLGAPQKDPV